MNNMAFDLKPDLYEPLKHMDAAVVVQAWQNYENLISDEASLGWLALAGGLDLLKVKTDTELLVMADKAPNDLLFGLAYGKLVDALSMQGQGILTPAHHVRITSGARGSVLSDLYCRVLNRGHALEVESEDMCEDYFDDPLLNQQSRGRFEGLVMKAAQAPTPFVLGQVTSWVLTSHRLKRPHLYTQVLDDLLIDDLESDALIDYCSTEPQKPVLVECPL